MPKFQQVPSYVVAGTTPSDMVAAEVEYARLCQNPAYDLVKGPRRAAVHAKFASGMALSPGEAVEFASIVPEGYRAGSISSDASDALAREHARQQFAESERLRIAAEAAKPRTHFGNIREAQDNLSMADYQKYLSTPEGQRAVSETYG